MKGRGSVSAWCVDHPVATLLLTFALVLLGLIAFPRLPRRVSTPIWALTPTARPATCSVKAI